MPNLISSIGVLAESESLFTIGGLPLHPLLVHAAVVLLPLSVLGLIAVILKPRLRPTFNPIVITLLAVAGVSSELAALTGEQLADVTGISEQHERFGKILGILALGLAVIAYFWHLAVRNQAAKKATILGTGGESAAAISALALSAVALVLVAVVGHSGATAVWSSKVPSNATPESSQSGSPSDNNDPSRQPSASESSTQKTYTAAEVAKHNTASDCWTMIANQAFDVTDWISKHPGGQTVIENLCGINGNDAFVGQHGTTGEPVQALGQYWLGPIG